MSIASLLAGPLKVVNIGLSGFARDLAGSGVAVADVDWSPPPNLSPELQAALDRLLADPGVDAANEEAFERLAKSDPVLLDVRRADEAVPGLGDRMVLHAGPPIEWPRMCGPMRGAVQGAIVLEGWASDLVSAERLADSGAIRFAPNHQFGAVGPMTGIITRSMPVMVVENRAFGNRAYCTLNEGLGKVMRFGGNDASVLDRLRWIAARLGPALGAALRRSGGLALKPLIARGLAMGDEMHQRNVACTSLFVREMGPALAEVVEDRADLAAILRFVGANDQFFLNIAMAMAKAIADPVREVARSTVVACLSRNGTDFGIHVAGLGARWFTAPVEMPKGLYFPGFGAADANPDMGDSAIVETVGLGGFAMAASPAVAGFIGAGGMAEALRITRDMFEITLGRSPDWKIATMDFAGVPLGIDVRKVVAAGLAPIINTGIAHREPGIGQVGAGVVKAPLACFHAALLACANEYR